jgi:hypothetical protein
MSYQSTYRSPFPELPHTSGTASGLHRQQRLGLSICAHVVVDPGVFRRDSRSLSRFLLQAGTGHVSRFAGDRLSGCRKRSPPYMQSCCQQICNIGLRIISRELCLVLARSSSNWDKPVERPEQPSPLTEENDWRCGTVLEGPWRLVMRHSSSRLKIAASAP